MFLSNLQKYILLECYYRSGKIYLLENLINFYRERPPKNAKKIITKSLERMINKELLSVMAKKTHHKLFIKEIKLTNLGRKLIKKILNQKQKLPLKIKNKKYK